MVDKDAICPINLMSYKFNQLNFFFNFGQTNLGLTSVDLIFYTPNVANLGIWKIVYSYSSDNYILIPRMPMPED